ncbi:MAG: hypothetical protein IJM30_00110 [Thermoguttaceae bacterium]|nr:hypothetical protein [Thermoguttaceae bacterium]
MSRQLEIGRQSLERVRSGLFLALLVVFVSGCCLGGYQLGPEGIYDLGVKTVYVPMVEADTYREGFAERLTEAIVKKITEQTPYRIASSNKADSILTVRLVGETQRVSALNRYDDARQKNVELTATAVWRDLRSTARVDQSPSPSLAPNSGVTILSQSFLVPEMGQSTATAQQEAIDKLAQEIVGLMETPW